MYSNLTMRFQRTVLYMSLFLGLFLLSTMIALEVYVSKEMKDSHVIGKELLKQTSMRSSPKHSAVQPYLQTSAGISHSKKLKEQKPPPDGRKMLKEIHKGEYKPDKRPSLDKLIHDRDEKIRGDVRWLLDFAILGYAKCATSFLNHWIMSHPEVQSFEDEVCDIYDNRPANLVYKLYEELPEDMDYKRGFKCPGHFSRRPMRYFRRYWSKTVLIVGVRHPIKWFQSFYNFRVRKGHRDMPPPEKLIGQCIEDAQGVCTSRGNFATGLAIFGKTNNSDPHEQSLIRVRDKHQWITRIDNPIFLYHTNQLPVYDQNRTRVDQFMVDIQNYLGLEEPMPEAESEFSSREKFKAINICEKEWDPVRAELLLEGRRASRWIRHYFLKSSQVFVSNQDHFEELLKEWELDPCLNPHVK